MCSVGLIVVKYVSVGMLKLLVRCRVVVFGVNSRFVFLI